jgi:2-polyprenyl-3-methyl-5-hydroxy-6-metoxy-1,4-benzoquinol methylase
LAIYPRLDRFQALGIKRYTLGKIERFGGIGMKVSTIERLIPDQAAADDVTGQATLKLHLQRYEFAAEHLKPGRLLDIACGVGYGTRLMAEKASNIVEAVGVDLSQEAVEYARQHYASGRIQFQRHDAMTFADERGFESIVSVETLEHVSDPIGLINHLVGLIRPGGVFIASVPTTPSVDVNPYHLHDFTERSFRSMVTVHGLRELACLRQVQPYQLMRTLKREESRMKDMRQGLMSYYLRHPGALAKRLWSTQRYGFTNRYLTVVWQKVR